MRYEYVYSKEYERTVCVIFKQSTLYLIIKNYAELTAFINSFNFVLFLFFCEQNIYVAIFLLILGLFFTVYAFWQLAIMEGD